MFVCFSVFVFKSVCLLFFCLFLVVVFLSFSFVCFCLFVCLVCLFVSFCLLACLYFIVCLLRFPFIFFNFLKIYIMVVFFQIACATAPPEIPESLNPAIRDVLLRCFEQKPEDRPPAMELLKHPLFTQVTSS